MAGQIGLNLSLDDASDELRRHRLLEALGGNSGRGCGDIVIERDGELHILREVSNVLELKLERLERSDGAVELRGHVTAEVVAIVASTQLVGLAARGGDACLLDRVTAVAVDTEDALAGVDERERVARPGGLLAELEPAGPGADPVDRKGVVLRGCVWEDLLGQPVDILLDRVLLWD